MGERSPSWPRSKLVSIPSDRVMDFYLFPQQEELLEGEYVSIPSDRVMDFYLRAGSCTYVQLSGLNPL